MNVEVTKDTTIFWMSFLSHGDSTEIKWINIRIDDLSEDTVKLSVLLELTYKYTTKRKGPWHERAPGYYGWYSWDRADASKLFG